MSDAATLRYYEQAAPHYTASTAAMQVRHLDPFLDLLDPGAEILELGCGAGRDAAHMIGREFVTTATDGSVAMVRKAKERFGIDAQQMRFDQLDASEAYDAVWAHAGLLHATRAALPDILAAIYRALRPGGWHFANYKLGDDDHLDEGRDQLGRWTNLPQPEWLEARYGEAGFKIHATERYRGNGSDGTMRDWLALTVRKP